jgi:lipopolysaccharide transport system ATP-binding protein
VQVEDGRWGSGKARVIHVALLSDGITGGNVFAREARLRVQIIARALEPLSGEGLSLAFSIKHRKGLDLIVDTSHCHDWRFPDLQADETFEACFEFENILAPDEYFLVVAVERRETDSPAYLDFVEQALDFKVVSSERVFSFVKPAVTLHASPSRQTKSDSAPRWPQQEAV